MFTDVDRRRIAFHLLHPRTVGVVIFTACGLLTS
jgi:hypothetical protein